jgi:hypothetical protein
MNEKLKELAKQAGFHITLYPADIGWVWCSDEYPIDEQLERFAELVRQDEREACAAECGVQMGLIPTQAWTVNPYEQCMKAICARGEK